MNIKVVASGIDTLVLGFLIDDYLDVGDFELLSEAKEKAGKRQFNSKGSSVTWFGVDYTVSARGTKGFEWVLRNADVTVCIAREARSGSVMPEVYVTFSSQYLWTEGAKRAVSKFNRWLSQWAIIRDTKVSRCDLCIDLTMSLPVIDLKKEIVSRAKGKVAYSVPVKTEHYVSGRRDTGYKIGSGSLSARIYDKTNEIIVSQKEWFRDYWLNNGWDSDSSIVRCEFQCRREFLKEMGVNTFEELMECLADIWRYCTHDWLRICNVGSGTNQARWKCKEFWSFIQDNFNLFGKACGVLRMKVKDVKYNHLMKQVRGCLISACAITASSQGVSVAMFKIKQEIRDILSSEDFRAEVLERKALVANIEKPKSHLIDEATWMGAEIISVDSVSADFKEVDS